MAASDLTAQHDLTAQQAPDDAASLAPAALQGTSLALICTGVAGGSALALSEVSPWVAWGYVALALVFGIAIAALFGRNRR
jgi:hypothetical protein